MTERAQISNLYKQEIYTNLESAEICCFVDFAWYPTSLFPTTNGLLTKLPQKV